MSERIEKEDHGVDSGICRVGVVQFSPQFGLREQNTKEWQELVRQAAKAGAQVVVLPELCSVGLSSLNARDPTAFRVWTQDDRPPQVSRGDGTATACDVDAFEAAEDVPTGPTCTALRQTARELGIYLIGTVMERQRNEDRGDELYSTALAVAPDGEIVARYRKIHRFKFLDGAWAMPGGRREMFETPFGRVALCIGKDILHTDVDYENAPFNVRPWLVACPTAWLSGSDEAFDDEFGREMRARAASLQATVAIANWTRPTHEEPASATPDITHSSEKTINPSDEWVGFGKSVVMSERGALAVGGPTAGFFVADVPTRPALPPLPTLPASAPTGTVRVAGVQVASVMGRPDLNLQRIERACRTAAARGARIMVLPETAVTGYLSQDLQTNWRVPGKPMDSAFTASVDPAVAAEPQGGPSVRAMAALSAELGVYITVPFLEVVEGEEGPVYYNAVSLVTPDGTVGTHYRKNYPWPHPEVSWATAGKDLAMFDTEWGRVGLAICFDIHQIAERYNRVGKRDAEAGADGAPLWTLLYSIAWVDGDPEEHWFHDHLPQRFQDMTYNVVAVNWTTDDPQPWYGVGGSSVYLKGGRLTAATRTKLGDEIMYADIPCADAKP